MFIDCSSSRRLWDTKLHVIASISSLAHGESAAAIKLHRDPCERTADSSRAMLVCAFVEGISVESLQCDVTHNPTPTECSFPRQKEAKALFMREGIIWHESCPFGVARKALQSPGSGWKADAVTKAALGCHRNRPLNLSLYV